MGWTCPRERQAKIRKRIVAARCFCRTMAIQWHTETFGCNELANERPHAVKHFVAKLVKSFGGLGDAAESLDDFRYRKA